MINRYETAAVFAIVIFEVLTSFDYILMDITELWGHGMLVKLFKRFLIIIYKM